MITKTYGCNDPKVIEYVHEVFRPEDEVLKEIRERCQKNGIPAIQVGDMDALHLEIIARAIGAKKIVEIGTLGGYSGVCLARGLSAGGRLYTFEASHVHVAVAQESFQKAGLSNIVEVIHGPAVDTLPKYNSKGPFDLVFIDADKENYPRYLEWALENLRVGGVILADNTFGWGMIADQKFEDPADKRAIEALRKLNDRVTHSDRFRATILPTGEGLTMAVKLK